MKRFALCFLLLYCVSTAAAGDLPGDLDAYAARAMATFQVPGLALAVVENGRIVHLAGYGVRRQGESDRIDPDTLFAIASNSKAFTAAALAILVDEGKISWDDPVMQYLPEFRMYDPYVSAEITIRDLLTHRSGLGLGAGDLMFWPASDRTREEILHNVRFLKPATSFRSEYAYDNLLYMVAGQVIPAVTGQSWGDFVHQRIFQPLGMNRSVTSITAFPQDGNIASPHVRLQDQVNPVAYANIDNVGPAGSINSSAADMARWVMAQLDGGLIREDGRRLFSEERAGEMWSAQTILPLGDPDPAVAAIKPQFRAYGLGWLLQDYRGHKLVYHTGGLLGVVSRVTLLPERKLGIVVLTNQQERGGFDALTLHILDAYLHLPATDWIVSLPTGTLQKDVLFGYAVANFGARAQIRSMGSCWLANS